MPLDPQNSASDPVNPSVLLTVTAASSSVTDESPAADSLAADSPAADSPAADSPAVESPCIEPPPADPASAICTQTDSTVIQRWFLVLAGGVFLAVMTWRYLQLATQKTTPLPWVGGHVPATFQVEINSATWDEWMQLEGIGQTMAFRIVADRELHGDFASIDDLVRVDGIATTTLDRIRPWLTIRHEHLEPARSITADDSSAEPSFRNIAIGR
ncbi:MAG: helix-hairpin-helix domain-containing protein [Planctomycetaceae bacterium]